MHFNIASMRKTNKTLHVSDKNFQEQRQLPQDYFWDLYLSADQAKTQPMWPNQGPPPPPMGQQNPAFPPGYSAPYLSAPGPGVYPQAPYPGYPTAQYPPGHYSAPVSPAMVHHGPPGPMPHGPPGFMPYGPPGPHAYPMHPTGHPYHPKGVHLGHLLHYPKGFGHGPHKDHHHHHHDGFNPAAGILAGGMAVGMGVLSHKANKKMKKKMKKAHKYHKHGHYKHGKWSSSSSSDSD